LFCRLFWKNPRPNGLAPLALGTRPAGMRRDTSLPVLPIGLFLHVGLVGIG
jgi:hypothetical protein